MRATVLASIPTWTKSTRDPCLPKIPRAAYRAPVRSRPVTTDPRSADVRSVAEATLAAAVTSRLTWSAVSPAVMAGGGVPVASRRTTVAAARLYCDQMVRVLVVDDHEVVRRGLIGLLDAEDDIEVVGEAGPSRRCVAPGSTALTSWCSTCGSRRLGCRGLSRDKGGLSQVEVLILTSFADEEALLAAILAGASGYLLKRIDGPALVEAVRKVGAGESLLDPEMTDPLFRRLRDGEPEDPLLARLSPQERTILAHLADGMTNRQIAERMFLAEKTVKNYVSNLLAKLDMSRRSEAAAYAARLAARREVDHGAEDWPGR